MDDNRRIGLILLLFVALGVLYALATPAFEASDELWHYPMIRHLADGNPLPVQVFDAKEAGPWKQEASQPPLYYTLGALLTSWVDTSDMDEVRWLNPHVNNGVITNDGNVNLAIHDPAVNPWHGTLLAVRIVRLFSVLLGTMTVYLTYRIALVAVPDRPEIALGAAAVNAFLPMFLFISGAVNNDNLAIPLASLGILLMLKAVRDRSRLRDWLILGVVIGLAILTKEGTFALIPLAWGTIFVSCWQTLSLEKATGEHRQEAPVDVVVKALWQSIPQFLLLLLPVAVIAGWWYVRNLRLYGDWLGWSAFIAVLGQRPQPASLLQLWGERRGFLMSYWGLFGGVNVPMSPWIYQALNGLLVVSMAGFVIFVARGLVRWGRKRRSATANIGQFVATMMGLVEAHFPLLLCVLFSAAVIFGLIRWATTTWSSQGRLVFTAISSLSVLMTVGLAGWMPRRASRYELAGVGAFMFVVAAAAPFLWIAPAYRPQSYRPSQEHVLTPEVVNFSPVDRSQPRLRLLGYSVVPISPDSSTARPGQGVEVVLNWEVLSTMERDWSIFVHLTDPVPGVPIAQRDVYHAQGLRPTSLLKLGEKLETFHYLTIPETAISPADLQVTIGLYDFDTGERMLTNGHQESVVLTELSLVSPQSAYPNPVSVNFEDKVELVGFEIAPRRVKPGEMIDLMLYWRAIRPLSIDYTLFAQMVDPDTTLWANNNYSPPGGMTTWQRSVVQTIEMPLQLAADTPVSVYPIHIGLYSRTEEGGFERLQLVSDDGRITQEDHLVLTEIRVDR